MSFFLLFPLAVWPTDSLALMNRMNNQAGLDHWLFDRPMNCLIIQLESKFSFSSGELNDLCVTHKWEGADDFLKWKLSLQVCSQCVHQLTTYKQTLTYYQTDCPSKYLPSWLVLLLILHSVTNNLFKIPLTQCNPHQCGCTQVLQYLRHQ